MAIIKQYNKYKPEIALSAVVLETASVIGQVILQNEANVWYGAVIRGDVNKIIIGNGTNIQDNCVIHGTTGRGDTIIGRHCTIGHRALLHGCKVGNNVLIGMGAIVLDDAIIEDNAIIAAGAVILESTHVKSGELWAGVPAKKVKNIDAQRVNKLTEKSAKKYIALSLQHKT